MTTSVTYDKQNFIASLEPGLMTLVVQAFETKLAEKLDGIVQDVYDELKTELPVLIKGRMDQVMDLSTASEKVDVRINIEGWDKDNG